MDWESGWKTTALKLQPTICCRPPLTTALISFLLLLSSSPVLLFLSSPSGQNLPPPTISHENRAWRAAISPLRSVTAAPRSRDLRFASVTGSWQLSPAETQCGEKLPIRVLYSEKRQLQSPCCLVPECLCCMWVIVGVAS